jgi:hypothetical protein
MPPRYSRSRLQGILETPGFKGYPTGGNMASGFSSQKEEDLVPFEIKQAIILPKLNNGRRWVHPGKALPQHPEDKFYKIDPALAKVGAVPLSKTSSETGRASNPETAMIPNKRPIPFYEDLASAQQVASDQNALAQTAELGRFPTEAELVLAGKIKRKGTSNDYRRISEGRKIDENADMSFIPEKQKSLTDYFAMAKEANLKTMIENLQSQGFTEDEIRLYSEKVRSRDIEKAAEQRIQTNDNEKALRMMASSRPTGMNALGLSATTPLNIEFSQSVKQTGTKGGIPTVQAKEPSSLEQPSTVVSKLLELMEDIKANTTKRGVGRPKGSGFTVRTSQSQAVKEGKTYMKKLADEV